MRTLLAALSMLSVLPLGRFQPTERELRRSLDWFPVVGVVLGAILWLLAWPVAQYCPPAVSAVLLALLPEVLTKGFHLDGLADSADGLLSGRPRERKLEIMRDSHLGTMGAAAIFAVLALKAALYHALPTAWLPFAAGYSALAGRCGLVWYIAFSSYARPEGGLGALWFGRKPWLGLGISAVLAGAAGVRTLHAAAWLPPVALVALCFLWSRVTRWTLGGATGDTIGAAEELTEVLILAVLVALALHWPG